MINVQISRKIATDGEIIPAKTVLQVHSLPGLFDISPVFGHVSGYLLGQRSTREMVTRCLGGKKKSILSALGAQQFRIWNSPGEFSVFFFFFFSIFIHKDGILQQGRFSLLGILIIFISGNYFPH